MGMVVRCRQLLVLLTLLSFGHSLAAHAAGHRRVKTSQSEAKIYPELVRIRFLQGDVRISRSAVTDKTSKSDWEKAVASLPILTGYSIATGTDGRAEIEFENASTVYLAENSVLAFNDLHSKDEIPYTSLSLLTGTLTMHIEKGPGEVFLVRTPTAAVVAPNTKNAYVRLSSYLDGFSIASRGNSPLELPDSKTPVPNGDQGKTFYFVGAKEVTPTADPARDQRMEAWDTWVDQKVKERTEAMAAVMKATGIDRPLPGLADLYGKGTFFKCKPYGTCWVPGKQKPAEQTARVEHYGFGPADPGQYGYGADPYGPMWSSYPYQGFAFPCNPDWIFDASIDPSWMPWDWGMCSYGEWIGCNGGYAWVAPISQSNQPLRYKLHHFPPVRWVREGRKVGFVPLHPRDVAGQPPLNRTHGILMMHGRTVQEVAYDPHQPLRVLGSEPRHFMKPVFSHLEGAKAPNLIVHRVEAPARPLAGGHGPQRTRLTYDRFTQSFLLKGPVLEHGRTVQRVQAFVGHTGMLQARAMGINNRGTYRTQMSFGGVPVGRIGPGGRVGDTSGGNWSSFNNTGSFSSGGSYGGMSGGSSMPVASGGPAASSGGAHR